MGNRINQFQKGASRRILSLTLAVCMVFTMSPPITAAGALASGVSDSGEIVLSGFAALPDEVREQSVPIGTSSAELILPEDTTTPAAITVSGVTWESAPIYSGDTEGKYIFTAVLPDGYTVEDGVAMPEITVTVGQMAQVNLIEQLFTSRKIFRRC